MRDEKFFTHPKFEWQRRYEALRALFIERLPHRAVADKFGYSPGYVRLLRHQFVHGIIDLSEPVAEGKILRRRVSAQTRAKIVQWRKTGLPSSQITELLSEDGVEISVRTVERIIAEEGLPKLARRTRIKTGMTVKGAQIPERSQIVSLADLNGQRLISDTAGVYLFAPLLCQLDIASIANSAGLPGSKVISAVNYLLSFLALKLLGTERYAHVADHAFDPALGLFAGLNVLPNCTAMSTYSYSLDEVHIQSLQKAFIKNASKLGLYDGKFINLDFHTVPHFGEESVLEKHWAGARGKRMKGALTLFAQDSQSKLILYTDADIRRSESDDQVLEFLSFWKAIRRGVKPTLVFDSKFISYAKLSELNSEHNVKFITLRRRGGTMVDNLDKLDGWKKIQIPHEKRKYPNPRVCESFIGLRNYSGTVRQVIVRDNGREKPAFLITNDFDMPVDLLVENNARRWRVENGIAEAVKFFHLNALSSPIVTKVQFDIALTMVADTLYTMLAKKLRGFEDCDAPKLFRHFVRGKGTVTVDGRTVNVIYPKRAHNPILRQVPWDNLPLRLPGLGEAKLTLNFS
jgi:Transposase DDE domain